MKNVNLIRMFSILFISIITISATALAVETHQKEVRLKIAFVSKDSKHKLETFANLLKGVNDAQFNNEKKELTVQYNPDEINSDMIVYAMDIIGYEAEIIEDKDIDKITKDKNTKESSNK